MYHSYSSTGAPTGDQKRNLEIVNLSLPELTVELKELARQVALIEKELNKAGAPYLEGQLPE